MKDELTMAALGLANLDISLLLLNAPTLIILMLILEERILRLKQVRGRAFDHDHARLGGG